MLSNDIFRFHGMFTETALMTQIAWEKQLDHGSKGSARSKEKRRNILKNEILIPDLKGCTRCS